MSACRVSNARWRRKNRGRARNSSDGGEAARVLIDYSPMKSTGSENAAQRSRQSLGRGARVADEGGDLRRVLDDAAFVGDAARDVHAGGIRRLDRLRHVFGVQPARE